MITSLFGTRYVPKGRSVHLEIAAFENSTCTGPSCGGAVIVPFGTLAMACSDAVANSKNVRRSSARRVVMICPLGNWFPMTSSLHFRQFGMMLPPNGNGRPLCLANLLASTGGGAASDHHHQY